MPPATSDLRQLVLFRGFTDAELGEVASLLQPVPVTDKPLFVPDEPAVALYVLTAGEVALERAGDDRYLLRPPALIGELGALTGLRRTSSATPLPGAEVWSVDAKVLQGLLSDNQELGVRFLVNLLDLVADKVQRDQRRIADMRQTVIRTQKQLKALREVVLEAPETPLSAPVHDALEQLIAHNRRVHYRVEPPAAMAAALKLETGTYAIAELSRSHVSVTWRGAPPAVGAWLAAVADLAGHDVPMSGTVLRVDGKRVTLELDMLIDEYAQALEGYLTRVQLLDVLV